MLGLKMLCVRKGGTKPRADTMIRARPGQPATIHQPTNNCTARCTNSPRSPGQSVLLFVPCDSHSRRLLAVAVFVGRSVVSTWIESEHVHSKDNEGERSQFTWKWLIFCELIPNPTRPDLRQHVHPSVESCSHYIVVVVGGGILFVFSQIIFSYPISSVSSLFHGTARWWALSNPGIHWAQRNANDGAQVCMLAQRTTGAEHKARSFKIENVKRKVRKTKDIARQLVAWGMFWVLQPKTQE